MKRNAMKTAAATALLMLCTAGASLAQPPGGMPDPSEMAQRQLGMMKERLKLTKDQEKQLKPILLDSAKQQMKMREKMTQGEPPSEEMRAEMTKSREAMTAKVTAILTDDQKTEYTKMQSERRGMGPGGPGGPGGEGRRRPPAEK
jgi:Spy/CpxP family protein refolding chaperone